jgi:hypothetical protein
MKKIFLFFGVAAFTSASAQQNDFFDVDKHLQKKNKKLPVLSIPKTWNFSFPEFIQENFSVYPFNGSNNYTVLPHGNKIYSLSQDHMPCIVPDMKEWGIMPNLAYYHLSHPYNWHNKKEFGQIPNAWTKPPVLIPE